MEETIQKAEEKIKTLEQELENPDVQSHSHKLTELYQELHSAQEVLEKLYTRWAELEQIAQGK
jgi:protein subunit release factor A